MWDLAACALYDLEIFLSLRFLCHNAGKLSHRLKVSLLAINSHEICNQLASYSECCAIGIPLLPCVFIYQSQIGVPPGRQLRRFDEHPLDMAEVAQLARRWVPSVQRTASGL